MVTNQMNEFKKSDVDAYNIQLALWLEDYLDNAPSLQEEYLEHSYDERGEFLADKIDKFKDSEWDDINKSLGECIPDYICANAEAWKRELKGEKLYKVKVVVEVDIESPWKLDEVVKEVQHRLDVGLDGAFQDETHRIIGAKGKEVTD